MQNLCEQRQRLSSTSRVKNYQIGLTYSHSSRCQCRLIRNPCVTLVPHALGCLHMYTARNRSTHDSQTQQICPQQTQTQAVGTQSDLYLCQAGRTVGSQPVLTESTRHRSPEDAGQSVRSITRQQFQRECHVAACQSQYRIHCQCECWQVIIL